ncbi:hypothetical protein BOW53_07710 [Solemya pervernicosa gill symbiont]|uniref:Polynucleotide kinase PNKP phosphatase domain-containing protein n=2 Tax=Gammaproteobacteria incertae sedis TaxID=118884 RepID=A0A1T2L5X8_9GAMM|nr:hypothetical protein [Candidatus Reidiella endopervernicosa]OOZ40450.1 hypothetical protein BOW53_07710 [Solemya pervernicosa gill symbiont]QKQ25365.1 hypothetical protein HUE57_02970 [Candidatus Reidiella endopervernicosa]
MDRPGEIVICGLDGVLALIEHRLHHLYNEEGEKHWDRFHAACIDDMPNLPLVDRLNHARSEGTELVIISGRSAAVRNETINWLAQWDIGYDALWLRPEREFNSSAKFKAALLDRRYPQRPIRRIYESDSHLDVAQLALERIIPCTLIGHNQGNGESRELFELRVINHSCDHTTLYPFYGDEDFSWDERTQQLTAGPCRQCQVREQQKEQKQKATVARLHAQGRGLPPLEGSERQTEWAEGIRQKGFGAVDKVLSWIDQVDAEAQREDPDHWYTVKQGIDRSIKWLEEQADAKWWIDNRHGIYNNLDAGRSLLSAIAEQQGFF